MSNIAPTAIPTGQEHARVDGRLKVTGRALYTAAAERAPGVVGILSGRNIPRLAPPPADLTGRGQPGEPCVPLQDDRIHWSGQHLALVVAETS